MLQVTHPFDPVVDADCRLLILGSFPSVRSRENAFYYGHPQNRFWRVIAGVFDEPVPASVGEKKAFLLRHHIALWDVIASCGINGSSDASIRDAVPVDIDRVMRAADIRTILCNGSLAGKLYARHLAALTGLEAITLPSTSPANAAWSLERLTEAWRRAILEQK